MQNISFFHVQSDFNDLKQSFDDSEDQISALK